MTIRDGRFLHSARVTIEAKAPLMIASGEPSLEHDVMLARDPNGLPMIPARSLTGALREALGLEKEVESDLFGETLKQSSDPLPGRLALSDGLVLGLNQLPVDGLAELPDDRVFAFLLRDQPVFRDHVRLSSNGVVDGDGKFTRAACPRGARFVVALEVFGTETDKNWDILVASLPRNLRLGGATRAGYGAVEIAHIETRSFDMSKGEERLKASRTRVLTEPLKGKTSAPRSESMAASYSLALKAEEAFRFGQGSATGKDDADLRPVRETVLKYEANAPDKAVAESYFAPASSIKGALRHRTAYHLRRRDGKDQKFVEDLPSEEKPEDVLAGEQERVEALLTDLFGTAKNDNDDGQETGIAGCLYIEGLPLEVCKTRTTARTTIDRFSGGVIRGRLFTENAIDLEQPIPFRCQIVGGVPETLRAAFEDALADLCTGRLPLGAGGNKGQGAFSCSSPPETIAVRIAERAAS